VAPGRCARCRGHGIGIGVCIPHVYGYCQFNGDCVPICHAHRYRDTLPIAHALGIRLYHHIASSLRDTDTDRHTDTYVDGDRHIDSHGHTDGHRHTDTHSNADSDCLRFSCGAGFSGA